MVLNIYLLAGTGLIKIIIIIHSSWHIIRRRCDDVLDYDTQPKILCRSNCNARCSRKISNVILKYELFWGPSIYRTLTLGAVEYFDGQAFYIKRKHHNCDTFYILLFYNLLAVNMSRSIFTWFINNTESQLVTNTKNTVKDRKSVV